MRKTTIQTVELAKAANTAAGTFEVDYVPDTNYDKIIGMVVFEKGAHTNYDIGLKRHNGESLIAPVDRKFFQQLNGERYFAYEREIDSNKLKVTCNINEQQAGNALAAQVAFIIAKD